jgi:hypothetical protein
MISAIFQRNQDVVEGRHSGDGHSVSRKTGRFLIFDCVPKDKQVNAGQDRFAVKLEMNLANSMARLRIECTVFLYQLYHTEILLQAHIIRYRIERGCA